VPANDVTVMEVAELGLTASRPAGPIAAGDPLPVTVTLANRGPATARDLRVALQSSPGTIVRWTATHGSVVEEDQGHWSVGALAPGATATLRYDLFDPGLQGGSFPSGPYLASAGTFDLDTRDDVAPIDLGSSPEGTADLALAAEVRPADDPSQRLVRVTVTNTGPAPADGRETYSVLTFTPGRGEIVTATASSAAWACSFQFMNVWSCYSSEGLPAGAGVTVEFLVQGIFEPDTGTLEVTGAPLPESELTDNRITVAL
jgi:hypothetical protein